MTNFLATMRENQMEQAVQRIRDMQRQSTGKARRYSDVERTISRTLTALQKNGVAGRTLTTFERVVARVYADRLQGKPRSLTVLFSGPAGLPDASHHAATDSPSSGRAAELRAKVDAAIKESDECRARYG